jgi:hypothetical protein
MSDDWTRADVNRRHDQGRAATTPDVITREAEARAREHVARAREADARSRLWNGLAVFLWGFLAANAPDRPGSGRAGPAGDLQRPDRHFRRFPGRLTIPPDLSVPEGPRAVYGRGSSAV